MRAPNILIFLFTLVLGSVGLLEHLAIPINVPDVAVPLIGSTKAIAPFLEAYSFWVVFTAWLLLAIGVFRRSKRVAQPA